MQLGWVLKRSYRANTFCQQHISLGNVLCFSLINNDEHAARFQTRPGIPEQLHRVESSERQSPGEMVFQEDEGEQHRDQLKLTGPPAEFAGEVPRVFQPMHVAMGAVITREKI